MNWAEYTEAARQLAQLRGQETDRRETARQRMDVAQGEAGRLRERLDAQRAHLIELAERLGEPRPALDGGLSRTGLTDVEEAVRRAGAAADTADEMARRAAARGELPVLLPTLGPGARNALVYAATTALAWLVSCGMWFSSPSTNVPTTTLLWSMCGLPAIALFAGYAVIAFFARPRIDTGGKVEHSVRLGGVICFGGMWLAWLALIVLL